MSLEYQANLEVFALSFKLSYFPAIYENFFEKNPSPVKIRNKELNLIFPSILKANRNFTLQEDYIWENV